MMKIGVLISGGGTNLQSIIDTVHGKSGEIAVVISNKADAYGLTRAKNADIPAEVIVENDCADVDDFNAKMIDVLKDYDVELVVLAGFMRILTPAFIAAYPNRIVNIHPALIPSFCGEGFYGMRVHRAIFEYGVKISGPGEVILIMITVKSMTGEKRMMASMDPMISMARFTILFKLSVSGTCRMFTTGSPSRSSVYGLVGMIVP